MKRSSKRTAIALALAAVSSVAWAQTVKVSV